MGREWYHGIYEVENRDKYIGHSDPKYRSSWECRFAYYLDHNPMVKRWGYEILEIPYQYDLDNGKRKRKYIVDFYAEIQDVTSGNLKKYVIEVKPKKQTRRPDSPGNKNKKRLQRYVYEMKEYIKNQNKWRYATAWCKGNGMIFKIITEAELKTL